jgi:hypothetical protein
MKNTLCFTILGLALTTAAHAQVACEAIKAEQAGQAPLRGVRVTYLGKTHAAPTLFGAERAVVYFGSDSKTRDHAGNLCNEVVAASRCEERKPLPRDQYTNRGDPGFGPAMWQKDSTKAATFYATSVSSEAQKHVGDTLSAHHGEYHKYYSACETLRAEIAHELLKKLHREYVLATQPEEMRHFEPIKIYEKF